VDPLICAEGISRCVGKNTLEDLEKGLLEYKIAGEFLADIKK